MTTLIMMYVYYDTDGNIKSISPDYNLHLSAQFSFMTTPVVNVEGFLTGSKNPFNYFVKDTTRLGTTTYTITRKPQKETHVVRDTSSFLSEVKLCTLTSDSTVLIENFIGSKTIRVSLNPTVKHLLVDGTDTEREQLELLYNSPVMHLYFTLKGDPYYLIESICIHPKDLFDKENVYVQYTGALDSASVFTKKIIDGYGYSKIH